VISSWFLVSNELDTQRVYAYRRESVYSKNPLIHAIRLRKSAGLFVYN